MTFAHGTQNGKPVSAWPEMGTSTVLVIAWIGIGAVAARYEYAM